MSIGYPPAAAGLPTHLDLPESDGKPVNNALELPQTTLLTGSLQPLLRRLHPAGDFFIAANTGIYWRHTKPEPLAGCKCPDWYYVPGVPQTPDGYRRSYVLWQEKVPPPVVIEYVSGDGSEERDTTPDTGKFWVYERGIKAGHYLIWEPEKEELEVYRLVRGRYRRVPANARGRFPFEPLGIEFGLRPSECLTFTYPWIRAWDAAGDLIPSWDEVIDAERVRAGQERARADAEKARADAEKARAEQERVRAGQEKARADVSAARAAALAAKLRELGLDPDAV